MNPKKIAYEHTLACLSAGRFAEAQKIMELWDNDHLATFLLHNTNLLPALRTDFFDNFWKNHLYSLKIPSRPDFHFLEQPGINNADLVIGYLFYLLELAPLPADGNAENDRVLFKETDFLSIHLVRLRLHFLFLGMKDLNAEDLARSTGILYNLEGFAKMHGTPGYMLLANGYAQLGRSLQKLNATEPCMDAFKLCWKYLHLAELEEKTSAESINNAYFGKGMIMSTPFELATITEIKSFCSSYAGSLLPLTNQKSAEYAAELVYQNALKLKNAGSVSVLHS